MRVPVRLVRHIVIGPLRDCDYGFWFFLPVGFTRVNPGVL